MKVEFDETFKTVTEKMKVYIENAKKSASAPAPSKRDRGKREAGAAAMYGFLFPD